MISEVMSKPHSPVLAEIGWLAFFLAVFAALVYLLMGLVVPHHFNVTIAIMLAAIFAGLIMIATRAWLSPMRRKRR
jgi:membrane protein implicated in regulation of membrane protease activity